ncbi:MAG: Peptidyl-prolyl cis-trans isomerase (rotamase)-cyclophilin family [Chthonomonadaceae bacterium]|nr:Peptidyl-prolyl cis-trans isomerase (rotamase)-cyclophilin family [Chthonomonadaceae bacterium]
MANRYVLMDTTQGPIKFELFEDLAPITTTNFANLVESGFYNGLNFHRYEPGFVIQGGDPLGTGMGGSKQTIPLEVTKHLRHDAAGVVAMARSSDPNSASSQFYFTLRATPHLDDGYAVFGKVTEGLENLMKLRKGDVINKASVVAA